jgi:hypothetical protein
MRSVLEPLEVHHTVETGVGSAAALVSMRVEFFLCEHVAAVLFNEGTEVSILRKSRRSKLEEFGRGDMGY